MAQHQSQGQSLPPTGWWVPPVTRNMIILECSLLCEPHCSISKPRHVPKDKWCCSSNQADVQIPELSAVPETSPLAMLTSLVNILQLLDPATWQNIVCFTDHHHVSAQKHFHAVPPLIHLLLLVIIMLSSAQPWCFSLQTAPFLFFCKIQ